MMQWFLTIGLLVAGSSALAPLMAEHSPTRIAGSYLVQFKAHTAMEVRRDHIKRIPVGVTVQKEWDFNEFHGYHMVCAEKDCPRALGLIREEKSVLVVEADQIMSAIGDAPVNNTKMCACQRNTPSWGLIRVGSRTARPSGSNFPHDDQGGSGVSVCILDTGIRYTLADFGGRAVNGATFAGGNTATDNHGHGTHVAGTVASKTYGIAKGATVVAVKVLSDNGSGSTAGVVSGCEYSSGRCTVSNLSLGGGASTVLDNAINAMNGQVAVAAGNDGRDACNYSPARARDAITVGSTTSTDGVSSFSNTGSCLNGWAPGSSITSLGLTGNAATMSGTSMAAPHVAGALAANGQWINNIISSPGSPSAFIYAPDCPDAC